MSAYDPGRMPRTHLTPPMLQVDSIADMYYHPGSASTSASSETPNCSPGSCLTADSTPPSVSPARFRESGPMLLPKVRSQDQTVEHRSAIPMHLGHNRTQSLPNNNGYPMQFGAQLQIPTDYQFQTYNLTGPYFENQSMNTSYVQPSQLENKSRPPPTYRSVSSSATPQKVHARNLSSSSIDPASVPNRYLRPTYRVSPGPQSNGGSITPNAMSHLLPMVGMGSSAQSYPVRRRNPSPQAKSSKLSALVEAVATGPSEQTSLAKYLSKPNPKMPVVSADFLAPPAATSQDDIYWFDVRSVNSWTDFTIATINAFPQLPDLLHFPTTLSEPERLNIRPESRLQVAEACSKHYLQKLNTALSFAQGSEHHLSARAMQQTSPARQGQLPDFASNYSSDSELTLDHQRRGRVIGIARCFNEWNTGMRNGDENKRVQYLTGLAALHSHLRNHRCRYGFIITEIELVCVRAGGTGNQDGVPFFGCLEIATVPLSAEGTDSNGNMKMTAGLALWYLHMLARDQTLPGQMGWQLHLGGPAACSRQIYYPTIDSWIPQKLNKDIRVAKRKRKWVNPGDPPTSAETGRARKRVA